MADTGVFPDSWQPRDVRGLRALVTGSTNGIGLEAAVALAKAGAEVIIVGRDPARTEQALEQVRSRSAGSVEAMHCDFASQASIRDFAAAFQARYDRLHILVNNAGTVFEARTLTEDGIESTFAVNHLGYFLLTVLLRDLLIRSAPARIVVVSSRGHYAGKLDLDDVGYEKGGYFIFWAYTRSKLANVLFTRALARRLEGTGVTVNACHPGDISTNIWSHAQWWSQPFLSVLKWFLLSPEEGGQRLTFLAVAGTVEGKSGLFFWDNKEKEASKAALDDALGERLWALSARLVNQPDA
jgi:NAD(P)-dependent dehydrogenase (short-subunit alcohol dehydrogenase family)